MLVVVTMDLSVAFKADRNGIANVAGPVFGAGQHVVHLDLDAAKAVTDAASAVALHQEIIDLLLLEFVRHLWAESLMSS